MWNRRAPSPEFSSSWNLLPTFVPREHPQHEAINGSECLKRIHAEAETRTRWGARKECHWCGSPAVFTMQQARNGKAKGPRNMHLGQGLAPCRCLVSSYWISGFKSPLLVLKCYITKTKGLTRMIVHFCNPSTWEAKAGGSWVWGQPWLHREF
jgi:hypothetical protein